MKLHTLSMYISRDAPSRRVLEAFEQLEAEMVAKEVPAPIESNGTEDATPEAPKPKPEPKPQEEGIFDGRVMSLLPNKHFRKVELNDGRVIEAKVKKANWHQVRWKPCRVHQVEGVWWII